MSSDLSAEITAIATAVLAVGAIFTAVFAMLAFRKQSQEVGILQQQMHEHQQALEHEAAERHRAQASRVWIVLKVIDDDLNPPVLEAMVTNASEQEQPIYNARLHWYCDRALYGTPNPERLGAVPGHERTTRRREFLRTDPAACGAFLTFRDAAVYAWMRAPDGALTDHPPSELDDAARAAIARLAPGSRQNQTDKAG